MAMRFGLDSAETQRFAGIERAGGGKFAPQPVRQARLDARKALPLTARRWAPPSIALLFAGDRGDADARASSRRRGGSEPVAGLSQRWSRSGSAILPVTKWLSSPPRGRARFSRCVASTGPSRTLRVNDVGGGAGRGGAAPARWPLGRAPGGQAALAGVLIFAAACHAPRRKASGLSAWRRSATTSTMRSAPRSRASWFCTLAKLFARFLELRFGFFGCPRSSVIDAMMLSRRVRAARA